MLPKAILFDLDDTITSHDRASDYAWEETCYTFAENMNTPFSGNVLLKKINETRKWYWSDPKRHEEGRINAAKARNDIVNKALKELQYYDEACACKMADNYGRLKYEKICLFPDSIKTLEELKALGVRMALITNGNSEEQRDKIDRFGLSDYFEFYLVEEEVGFGKPDLRVFQIALQQLGLKAEEVWMVGDNLVCDVEAPQRVGIFSIWNDFEKEGLSESSTIVPDRIINSIVELLP